MGFAGTCTAIIDLVPLLSIKVGNVFPIEIVIADIDLYFGHGADILSFGLIFGQTKRTILERE